MSLVILGIVSQVSVDTLSPCHPGMVPGWVQYPRLSFPRMLPVSKVVSWIYPRDGRVPLDTLPGSVVLLHP